MSTVVRIELIDQGNRNMWRLKIPRSVLLAACCYLPLIWWSFSLADDEFNPKVVINRKFPTIKVFDIQSVDGANKVLKDEELVLAVKVNGKPRAYAINMLTGPRREIINDTLGGRSIAATW